MVKKKPLAVGLNRDKTVGCCCYNMYSGRINLPKLPYINDSIMKRLIDSFTHEWFHKFLHECFDYHVSIRWDNVDKFLDDYGSAEYCISNMDNMMVVGNLY